MSGLTIRFGRDVRRARFWIRAEGALADGFFDALPSNLPAKGVYLELKPLVNDVSQAFGRIIIPSMHRLHFHYSPTLQPHQARNLDRELHSNIRRIQYISFASRYLSISPEQSLDFSI